MKRFVAAFAVILLLGAFLHADVYIKSNTHTDAFSMMGQNRPAHDDVTEIWMSTDAIVTITPSAIILLDLKHNKMDMIMPASKTYAETTLPLDFTKLLPPEAAQMMGSMKSSVTVTPNGQTKQIGQWKCKGYDATLSIMMMTGKQALWATPDVPFDPKMYMEKAYGTLLKTQMFDDASLKEYQKIDGFVIASDMSMEMMGSTLHTTNQVVEIAKKPAPAGIYAVPAGFQKTDTLSMQDLQRR